MPFGALLGGAMGTWIGLRPTILVGGIGSLLAGACVLWSPVRTLRTMPTELQTVDEVVASHH